MNMQEAVSSVLSQYAGFTGRARRSEFWFWTLAVFLVSIVAAILDAIIGWIILIVWFATDSTPDNQYGPNPKGNVGGGYAPPTV